MTWFVMSALAIMPIASESCAPPKKDGPRYVIRRTSAKIVIDGRLDESAWRAARSVGKFHFPWWEAGKSVLFLGHEFQQGGTAFGHFLLGALDGRDDLRRVLYPFPVGPQSFCQIGVFPVQVGEAKALRSYGVVAGITTQDVVVQDQGQDGNLVADRRLDIHTRHSNGGIAHYIDNQLVRCA